MPPPPPPPPPAPMQLFVITASAADPLRLVILGFRLTLVAVIVCHCNGPSASIHRRSRHSWRKGIRPGQWLRPT